jgi:CRISPR system Cascade subunit CasD
MTGPNSQRVLFLRLEGPMQSWGFGSSFGMRGSAPVPTKSGVLGLVCCAMGICREDAPVALRDLRRLRMGVRVDRQGNRALDYQTVGARVGNMAAGGGIKKTEGTGEVEAVQSWRWFLQDASFLVALCGDVEILQRVDAALRHPVWPVYLGRKAFVPSRPVFDGLSAATSLDAALASRPWHRRGEEPVPEELDAFIECEAGDAPLPSDAELWQDDPVTFRPPVHEARAVCRRTIRPLEILPAVLVEDVRPRGSHAGYSKSHWRNVRAERLRQDHDVCVFCKSAATEGHHVSYERQGKETTDDVRSLCDLCHDAVTMLEYGRDMGEHRIDPCDVRFRSEIQEARQRIIEWRSVSRRRRRLSRGAD